MKAYVHDEVNHNFCHEFLMGSVDKAIQVIVRYNIIVQLKTSKAYFNA